MKLKFIDLSGQKFNKLTVMERVPNVRKCKSKPQGYVAYKCKCDCGKEIIVVASALKNNNTKSCGCLKDAEDLGGKVFGKLTVINRAPDLILGKKKKISYVAFYCNCECGKNNVIIKAKSLIGGHATTCGCSNFETKEDLIGQQFGLLTVIERVENRNQCLSRPEGHIHYKCLCTCGRTTIVYSQNLKLGSTSSCGCITTKNEFVIGKFLDLYEINYISHQRLRKLNEKFPNLIVDYLLYNKIIIEYNGAQHYRLMSFKNLPEEIIQDKFNKQVNRDRQLESFCKANNYKLVVIDGEIYQGKKLEKYLEEKIIPKIKKILQIIQ